MSLNDTSTRYTTYSFVGGIMRALLDTNIIIHREASKTVNQDIGTLFKWLEKSHCEKIVHTETINEISKHCDKQTVETFNTKIKNYEVIEISAPMEPNVLDVSNKIDTTENDKIDTILLNEVYTKRVDFLITEDKKIHKKAEMLGISEKVFSIDSFLEKIYAEHPDLVDYKVLNVQKIQFGKIDLDDGKFDNKIIKTFDEYKQLLDKYEMQYDLSETDFSEYDYYAFIIENDDCSGKIDTVEDATIKDNKINILINYTASCGVCAPVSELYLVRFNKNELKDNYELKNINDSYFYCEENGLPQNETIIETDTTFNCSFKEIVVQIDGLNNAITKYNDDELSGQQITSIVYGSSISLSISPYENYYLDNYSIDNGNIIQGNNNGEEVQIFLENIVTCHTIKLNIKQNKTEETIELGESEEKEYRFYIRYKNSQNKIVVIWKPTIYKYIKKTV